MTWQDMLFVLFVSFSPHHDLPLALPMIPFEEPALYVHVEGNYRNMNMPFLFRALDVGGDAKEIFIASRIHSAETMAIPLKDLSPGRYEYVVGFHLAALAQWHPHHTSCKPFVFNYSPRSVREHREVHIWFNPETCEGRVIYKN